MNETPGSLTHVFLRFSGDSQTSMLFVPTDSNRSFASFEGLSKEAIRVKIKSIEFLQRPPAECMGTSGQSMRRLWRAERDWP
jgi:hypothetical protein